MSSDDREGSAAKADGRGRRGRGWMVAAVVVILVVAVLAAAAHVAARRRERKVEAKIEELRAAGVPLTWEEILAEAGEVPDEENAALVLMRSFPLIDTPDDEYGEFVFFDHAEPLGTGAHRSVQFRQKVRAVLADNAGALRLIHEAAALPGGGFPIDPLAGPWEQDNNAFQGARQAAELCAAEAVLRAEEGDADGAMRCLATGQAVGHSFGASVTSMPFLIRVATWAFWRRGLMRTLEVCELPVEGLRELRDGAERAGREMSSRLAVCAELATVRHFLNSGRRGSLVSVGRPGSILPGVAYVLIPTLRERDELLFYGVVGRAARSGELPEGRRWAETRAVVKEMRQGAEVRTRIISRTMLPGMARMIEEDLKAQAWLRVARAALAVEEWRVLHGQWPEALEQLMPDLLASVPADPFSDGPVRMAKTENGVVVYSVGPDGDDDGGRTEEEAYDQTGSPYGRDFPFRLIDPELRGAKTRTFREDALAAYLSLQGLKAAGYTEEGLKDLGFTDEDLETIERR